MEAAAIVLDKQKRFRDSKNASSVRPSAPAGSATTFAPSGERCPLCASDSLISHMAFAHDAKITRDMQVLQCADCDLAWQWPVLRDTNESLEYFQERYASSAAGSYFDPSRKRAICDLQIEFIESLASKGRNLLDVGSGDGTFAEVAFQAGWSAYAVDPAGPERVDESAGRCLRLIKGSLADLPDDAKFGVITMWDVIEHLERPSGLLHECRDRLAPGGWLVIETGNFQSTGRITSGPGWWGYQEDHRWYFSPKTLEQLLNRSGFSSYRLCKRTLRPWIKGDGRYEGPSLPSYLVASAKRPWKAINNLLKFRELEALSKRHRETAKLQIFTLAAQATS